jgi:CHRD domain-containing protein
MHLSFGTLPKNTDPMLRTLSITRSKTGPPGFNPDPSGAGAVPRTGVEIYTGRLRPRSGTKPPGQDSASPSGTATMTRAGGRIRCTIWVRDLVGATSAELRIGTPDPEGAIVVPLFHHETGLDLQQGVLVSTSLSEVDVGGVTLAAMIAMMARGSGHVTVRTVAHPEGEIGGPLKVR